MSDHRRELWRFVTANLLKGFLWFGLIVLAFVVLRHLFDDYEKVLEGLQDRPFMIYSVFFISEMSIGLIPPEVIMEIFKGQGAGWFWVHLGIMTVLSYLGAVVAFYIGRLLDRVDVVHRLMTRPKFAQNIALYKKYGGVLILISAVTPVPFATVSLISGALGFSFKSFLFWASPRVLRFVVYGYLFWLA
jgi:membrane protein YqaA with SNARE-associated domain